MSWCHHGYVLYFSISTMTCKCIYILYLIASTGHLDSSLAMKAISFVFMILIFLANCFSFKLHEFYKNMYIYYDGPFNKRLKNIEFPIYHDFNIHCISFSNSFQFPTHPHSYYGDNNCFTETDFHRFWYCWKAT